MIAAMTVLDIYGKRFSLHGTRAFGTLGWGRGPIATMRNIKIDNFTPATDLTDTRHTATPD